MTIRTDGEALLQQWIARLEAKLDGYDELTRRTGELLQDAAAVISEHGGDLDDLRTIVRRQGKIGAAMVRAASKGWRNDPALH